MKREEEEIGAKTNGNNRTSRVASLTFHLDLALDAASDSTVESANRTAVPGRMRSASRGAYNDGYIDCGSTLPQITQSTHCQDVLASPGPRMTSHLGGDGPDPSLGRATPIASSHALFGKDSASGKDHWH